MKVNQRFMVLAVGAALACSSNVSADDFDIEETRTLTLEASQLQQLKVDAGAGFLKLTGDSSSQEISVSAELMVDEGNFKLELVKDGKQARLVADANPENKSNWFGDSPYINLTVTVPEQMMLDINDGSGKIEIKDFKSSLNLRDGSGSVVIDNVAGDVKVNDGSGSLEVTNIGGKLSVDDGSGSLTIKSVQGPVEVEDGSGGIDIQDLSSSLVVDDGSGGIDIKNVQGHVTIDDGSGSINLVKLANGVTILEEGSGGLAMKDVNGDVDIRD